MTTNRAARSPRKSNVTILLLLVSFGAVAETGEAQEDESSLAGNWEGSIALSDDYGERTMSYQFRISKYGKVRVYGGRRLIPLPFVLTELGNGAVISAQHDSSYWVESQTFNLVRVDDQTLLVYFWRVVDDFFPSANGSPSVWARGGHAEFRRTKR
jgi:hypothetical protein